MKRILSVILILIFGCEEGIPALQTEPDARLQGGPAVESAMDASMSDPRIPRQEMIDDLAPTWPNDASLNVEDVGEARYQIGWPEAIDDVSVTQYALYLNDLLIGQIDPEDRQFITPALTPDIPHRVRVIAIDATAHRSASLETIIEATDLDPPTWPNQARIWPLEVGETHIQITWSPALDQSGVVTYEVIWGDEVVEQVDAERIAQLDTLAPHTRYDITVIAIDGSGLRSERGLSISIETIDITGPDWPMDAQISTERLTSSELHLSWPIAIDPGDAEDSMRAVEYRVRQDSITIAQGPMTEWVVDILDIPSRPLFTVEAIDSLGNVGGEPLSLLVEMSDDSPPIWPAGATARARAQGESSVQLNWTGGLDNDEVINYRVEWMEMTQETENTALLIEGLTPWTEYNFRIFAQDRAGLITAVPLSTTAHTDDLTSPQWPIGGALTVEWTDTGALDLSWPEATDHSLQVTYSVTQNGISLIDGALETHRRLTELAEGTDYQIEVFAFDPAGNRTRLPLTTTVRRADSISPQWPAEARLLVSSLTETSMRLAWPPAQDEVGPIRYRVQWFDQSIETQATDLEIDDLAAWTVYEISVRALDGQDNASIVDLATSIQTPDLTPPTWVGDAELTASSIDSESVTLDWMEAEDNVAIAGYLLSQSGNPAIEIPSGRTNMRIDGLSPWTEYTFELTAFDFADNPVGMPLTVTLRTLDEAGPTWPEGAVLNIDEIGPNGATLTWPSAHDDVGVTAYLISLDGEELAQTSEETRIFRVDHLSPWREHLLSVRAMDAVGNESDESLEGICSTPDHQAPTWPEGTSVQITELTSTSVTISWPEAVDDGLLAQYIIDVDGVEQARQAIDQRSISLIDLQPATVVLLEVSPVDAANHRGAPLRLSVRLPDGGPPIWAPPRLNWRSTENELLLSWPQATDDVGVIGYRVYQDGTLVTETQEPSILIQGLKPGHTYHLKIEAGDAANHWTTDGPQAEIPTIERAYTGFRRLSREEYANSLSELLHPIYGTADDPNYFCDASRTMGETAGPNGSVIYRRLRAEYCTVSEIGYSKWLELIDTLGWLDAYPEETPGRGPNELGGGFSQLDQRVFDEHVGVWAAVSAKVSSTYFDRANFAYGKPDGWASSAQWTRCLVEQQILSAADYSEGERKFARDCISAFIQNFARRAFRRPLTDDEFTQMMSMYDALPDTYAQELATLPIDAGWSEDPEVNWQFNRGMRNVVIALLMSPQFLYHIELGDEDGRLTAHELANRLSYHFWKTMPDRALSASADDGSLLTEAGYQQQVNRLYADPRAEEGVRAFYHGYFWLEQIPSNWNLTPTDYLRAQSDWHPNSTLKVNNTFWYPPISPIQYSARRELSNLGTYYTRESPGTFSDMFRSNKHLLECYDPYDQGRCYGAGPWGMFVYGNGNCQDPYQECHLDRIWAQDTETGHVWGQEPAEIVDPNRYGLLTRIGFLMNDTFKERPIRRGLKIRDLLLCDPLPPPENCDVVRVPRLTGLCRDGNGQATGRECSHISHCEEEDGEICDEPFREVNLTVREVTEELTERPGTSCANCHSRLVNGMGHTLGHYSSQGLYRSTEPMISTAQRVVYGEIQFKGDLRDPSEWPAFDTQGTFIHNGQLVTLDGPEELADFLEGTGRMESCWAQHYFRYTMGRLEVPSDLQTIEGLADQLRAGETLADVYKSIVFTDAFRIISKPAGELISEEFE